MSRKKAEPLEAPEAVSAEICGQEALTLAEEPEKVPEAAVERLAPVWVHSASGLNLREAPGFEAGVLRVLNNGACLMADKESLFDGWIAVVAEDGTEGWVRAEYVG